MGSEMCIRDRFYVDEIVAIENNTNIFVIDENTPVFGKSNVENP